MKDRALWRNCSVYRADSVPRSPRHWAHAPSDRVIVEGHQVLGDRQNLLGSKCPHPRPVAVAGPGRPPLEHAEGPPRRFVARGCGRAL